MSKKIALLKIGSLKFANLKTTSSQQFYGIYNVIKSAGYDVDILTYEPTEWSKTFSEIKDINEEYDLLFAYNGPINLYGGAPCPWMQENFLMMAKWKKAVYFLYNDPNMPWKDLWPAVASKTWNTYKLEDIDVTSDIIVLSNMYETDFKVAKAKHKKVKQNVSFKYFPFNEWILYSDLVPGNIKNTSECDLTYGGSFRGGNRAEKMVNYFFNKEKISVDLFGTVRLDQFPEELIKDKKAPNFLGKQQMSKVLEVGARGIASIIFGDTNYNNNLITLRVFESILSGSVTFIDNDFDVNHQIFDEEFMYVKNGEELEDKIVQLKNDPLLREKMIECQNRYFYKIRNEMRLAKCLKEIIGE